MRRARAAELSCTLALLVGGIPAHGAQLLVPAGASVSIPAGSIALGCADLTVQGAMSLNAAQVTLARHVSIGVGATVSAGAATLTLGGDWTNAGTFVRGTGSVVFVDGCSTAPAQVTGATAFNNLTFSSTAGRTFILPAGGGTSVSGSLTLAGAAGSPIQVTSSNPSQPTTIALGPLATVSRTNAVLAAGVSIGIVADTASVDFGGQSLNTTSPPIGVTLANTGGSPLTIASFDTSGPFAVTHGCGTLAAGASCSAQVTFTPTVEGAASGSLTAITSGGNQVFTLAGVGERSLVTHYYRAILRRAPDAGGKAFWEAEAVRVAALGANVNETWFAMAQSFYASDEYGAFARDDAGFVTDLYNTFFNRLPDGAGSQFWSGQLAAGMPREVVLASFMFSAEFAGFTQAIFGGTAVRAEIDTVVDFYRGLLSRLPDDGGFAHWRQQFRAAQCEGAGAVTAQAEAISSAFARSAEYGARARSHAQYVGDLYNAFLRRGGDLGGVQFWIGQVATGARTREQVRQAFVASVEFQARVQAIIAQGCLR